MKAKKFLTLGVTLIITFLSIVNSNSIEPDIFVQSTVNRASQALSGSFSKEEKINKLKTIAKETVDIRGIGFYTLGQYRKSLSNDHKKNIYKSFWRIFFKKFF